MGGRGGIHDIESNASVIYTGVGDVFKLLHVLLSGFFPLEHFIPKLPLRGSLTWE